MDAQVWVQRERCRPVRVVNVVGGFAEAQLVQIAPLVVGEKGEAGAEAGAEGRLHLRRVDADGDEPAVRDFELVLELDEPGSTAAPSDTTILG